MAGLRIPLARPAETTNPGFVYNPMRISLVPVEPGLAQFTAAGELAGDWPQAAREYEARGDWLRAAQCAEKAGDRQRALNLAEQAGPQATAAFLRAAELPRLAVSVCSQELPLNEWGPFEIELENQGCGPALAIRVHLEGPSISARVQTLALLLPGEHARMALVSLAAHAGARVPFDLRAEYQDRGGVGAQVAHSGTLLVQKKPDVSIQNLGPVYNGPVDQSQGKVEAGGIKVEGDVGLIKPVEAGSAGGVFQFCPYCGKKYALPKTPLFCPFCGEKLG